MSDRLEETPPWHEVEPVVGESWTHHGVTLRCTRVWTRRARFTRREGAMTEIVHTDVPLSRHWHGPVAESGASDA